jgi:quinoprotein glucose dehydrogenase
LNEPDPSRSNFRYTRGRGESFDGPQGLPLIKPPYAKITAINLNTGEHLWWAVNGGEGPVDHPAIKHLDLPPMGTNARAGAMVTRTLLFVTEGSGRSGSATGGSPYLRAFDKRTGEVLARIQLPGHATGVPMTYLARGKQFIAVAVGSNPAQLVALSLPD